MKLGSRKHLYWAIAVACSICFYGLLLHSPRVWQPLSWLAFLLTAVLISIILRSDEKNLTSPSLWQIPIAPALVPWFAATCALLVAMIYRYSINMLLVPAKMEWFVLLSIAIGASEELIFRGVIQGEAGRWNPVGGLFLGAVAFAGYKALLFIWPSPQNQAAPLSLFSYSLVAGIGLGYTRKVTGSIWPALIAHGIFDAWVYMETSHAPWWVW